ncbi:uncharacterized protein LOC109079715 [Cyprinus carpio]|uniref:Uncharacterized protein LOC109079715 n=1 Tax=Cyprinus carpio TaxID=7962 RepID=A0A9R0ATB0_CYPCA|nr:uncharacterized protein LOC109079715 [Cyprinus carpio]
MLHENQTYVVDITSDDLLVELQELIGTCFLFCFCSWFFICVFAVLTDKVSLQDTVEAFIGGSVILPCSLSAQDLTPQDINVHWRQNGSKIVYDIVKGEDSVAFQDSEFKNRAESFPDEYLSGNFSIKLNNLQHTDGGTYNCYITHSSELKTIQLTINGADSVGESLLWVYIVVPVLTIVFIAGLILFCWGEKKTQASSISFVSTDEQIAAVNDKFV